MTEDEFQLKWKDLPTEHSLECDMPVYQLCTCGLQEQQAMQSQDRGRMIAEYDRKLREVEGLELNRLRPSVFREMGIVRGTLLWVAEAYLPLYGDGRLRSPKGYWRFMFR